MLKALLTIGDLPDQLKPRWCLDKLLIRSPMTEKKLPKADIPKQLKSWLLKSATVRLELAGWGLG